MNLRRCLDNRHHASILLERTFALHRLLDYLSTDSFSPCLCPPCSSASVLGCPLAPPSGACAVWRGCSWWPAALQTGCVVPARCREFVRRCGVKAWPRGHVQALTSPRRWSSWKRRLAPLCCPGWAGAASGVPSPKRHREAAFPSRTHRYGARGAGVCAHVVGSVDMACVVLVKESHQVEEQVERAVDGLLCCYSLTAIPAGNK